MGNSNAKPHPKPRNKKQVRWTAAERPSPPGKPSLLQENGLIPDLIHICWQKPERDGGSPISVYLVEHRRVGSTHWIKSSSLPVTVTELAVNGLEPGWRYQFRIRAENAVGLSDCSEISDPFTVILQRSAITAPKFTQELNDSIVLESSKVDFEVHFLGQPVPSICWFKDGFEIFSSNRIRITTISDKSILTILQATIADEGEIKCTGTNKAGHASTKSKLTVEAPPTIRLPKSYQDQDGIIFEIGETINLNVYVGGRPTPLVFWSHDGESIQNDDRYELEYLDKTATLKIENSIRTDRGEYQIKAVNKLSQDIASFLVTITDKPTPPGKARVLMTSGRSVTLSWSTPEDDGGCRIGNYIIEYYRVGWNVWLKAATCRQVTTLLGDLIEGSEYKFRVKAESPYGVSDPSEESETVFIPDTRRGINHPTDILTHQQEPSVLSVQFDRTNRASSSPRVSFSLNEDMPIRPERKKSGKTPEASPRMKRKNLSPIRNVKNDKNVSSKTLILSESMNLPISESIPKQTFSTFPKKDSSIECSSKRSPTLSPIRPRTLKSSESQSVPIVQTAPQNKKTKSPSPEISITHIDIENRKPSNATSASNSPDRSSNRRRRSFSDSNGVERKNNLSSSYAKFLESSTEETRSIEESRNVIRPPLIRQEFSGSSEFMLVLCPEGEQGAQWKKLGIEFEDDSIPPPLSLSAPELGTEPAHQPQLKRSSSSSELLNYHLMERLRDAVFDEQKTSEVKRNEEISERVSLDIPTIQVNSKPAQELVELGHRSPLNRRLSIEVVSKNHIKWSQRRHSLKNAIDVNIMKENKLRRFQETEENKRELMEYRQRTELESKRKDNSNTNNEINKSVDDDLMKDYEESVTSFSSDEEINSLSNERLNSNISKKGMFDDEEDEEIYNPRNRTLRTDKTIIDEPFEILTIRKDPPDSSIIPKPILKKKISSSDRNAFLPVGCEKSFFKDSNAKRKRSSSLTEYSDTYKSAPFIFSKEKDYQSPHYQQNISTFHEDMQVTEMNKSSNAVKRRSFSLIPSQANILKETFKNKNIRNVPLSNTEVNTSKSVSALANFTRIAGASMIISDRININKESEEEAMVAVNFYGDIVKSFGGKTKPIAEYSKTLDSKYNNFEERKISEIKPNIDVLSNETRYQTPSPINKSYIEVTSSLDENKVPENARSIYSTKFPSTRFEQQHIHKDNNDQIHKHYKADINDYVSNPTHIASAFYQRRKPEINSGASNKEFRKKNANISPIRKRNSSPKKDTILSQRQQFHNERKTENPQSRSNSVTTKRTPRSRDASTSPVRFQYWENELPSRHSLDRDYYKTGSIPSSRSSSLNRRSLSPMRPTLKEITTQTSFRVEPQTPADILKKQEELASKAEKRMKGIFEYFTDLAMVSLACWIYLFQNEYLALPILFILVYRQLSEKITKFRQNLKKYLPSWISKKLRLKKEEFQP